MAAPTPKQRATTLKRQGFDDGVIGAILGVSADDVRALVYDADPDVELQAPAVGGGALELAQAVLTHDEILTLPSNGYELVPDPGENKGIIACWAVMIFGGAFVGYDDVDAGAELEFRTGSAGTILNKLGILSTDQDAHLFLSTPAVMAFFPQAQEATMANNATVSLLDPTLLKEHVSLGHSVGTLWNYQQFTGALRLRLANAQDLSGGDPGNVLSVAVAYTVIDVPVFE